MAPSRPAAWRKLYAALTPLAFGHTLAVTMPAGFRLHPLSARQVDAACRVRLKAFYAAKGKELVTDFRACEKFHLSPACQEQEARREHHYQLTGSSCIATSS
ncbi:MAG: hypothetical protein ABSH15_13475 [Verrucomicrobiota bacterium]